MEIKNIIIKEIYSNNLKPIERYNKIKADYDKYVSSLWKDKKWDDLEELQGHMENLLIEVVKELLDGKKEIDKETYVCTLFVKYDRVNKFNISIINRDTGEIFKGRIKVLSNVKYLKDLGFYVMRSTL